MGNVRSRFRGAHKSGVDILDCCLLDGDWIECSAKAESIFRSIREDASEDKPVKLASAVAPIALFAALSTSLVARAAVQADQHLFVAAAFSVYEFTLSGTQSTFATGLG